jgi:hypothetical protein
MFNQTREKIKNFCRYFIREYGTDVCSKLQHGYEFRAELPRRELKEGALVLMASLTAIYLGSLFVTPTNIPVLVGVLFLASGFGVMGSAIWLFIHVCDYVKGQIELSIFFEEIDGIVDESNNKKEVS